MPPGRVLLAGGAPPMLIPMGGGSIVPDVFNDEGGGKEMLRGGRPGMFARLTGGSTSETRKRIFVTISKICR